MNESRFQSRLILKIRERFPDCIILKNDANYMQGLPDLLILFRDRWAALEVKASRRASIQPNQEHYVHTMNNMSYATFVYPENEQDVLNDLQYTFYPDWESRVS